MMAGDEFYDDELTSGFFPQRTYCGDCRYHFRGECPEGWPPSDRSPVRPSEVPMWTSEDEANLRRRVQRLAAKAKP